MADLKKFRSLARNWDLLGDTDPMFGVLSDPTKHGGKWDADEFFASGRAHVLKLLRVLGDARATFEPGRCLDFGCGVGRLTVPLSESFQETIGVDVARAMIEAARQHQPRTARCAFVVNQTPDLRQFASGTFDVVHSCLVLQHIPPDVSLRYIAEFLRLAKPGGLVVFQVPAETRTAAQISASHALPETAFVAALALTDAPATEHAGRFVTVHVKVTNRSPVTWRHDIPAGRHICLGNHWLHADGRRALDDDARAWLPHPIAPGETVVIPLRVQAPDTPGAYLLEVDLVQEHISWFAQKGSATARAAVAVTPPPSARATASDRDLSEEAAPSAPSPLSASSRSSASLLERSSTSDVPPPPPPVSRPTFWRRLRHRFRGATPTFEMHVIPRSEVERTLVAHDGQLIRAVDDNAAGPGWLSYTYICRRL